MRLSDLPHRDDGVVYDSILTDGDDLGFVRHQLNCLAHARSISTLRPVDNARYLQLCAKERELLGRSRRLARSK
jgi:hypothetical protein